MRLLTSPIASFYGMAGLAKSLNPDSENKYLDTYKDFLQLVQHLQKNGYMKWAYEYHEKQKAALAARA